MDKRPKINVTFRNIDFQTCENQKFFVKFTTVELKKKTIS